MSKKLEAIELSNRLRRDSLFIAALGAALLYWLAFCLLGKSQLIDQRVATWQIIGMVVLVYPIGRFACHRVC